MLVSIRKFVSEMTPERWVMLAGFLLVLIGSAAGLKMSLPRFQLAKFDFSQLLGMSTAVSTTPKHLTLQLETLLGSPANVIVPDPADDFSLIVRASRNCPICREELHDILKNLTELRQKKCRLYILLPPSENPQSFQKLFGAATLPLFRLSPTDLNHLPSVVPHTILLDRIGNVRFYQYGKVDIRKLLSRLHYFQGNQP